MFLVGIHLEDSVLNGLIFLNMLIVTAQRIIRFQTSHVATTEENNDFDLGQHP